MIEGLSALKQPCNVTLYSDSQYVVQAMEAGWPQGWKAKGWRRKDKKPAVNPDLWERLLALCETHRVKFKWVRGHTGHPQNERCDRLAVAAAKGEDLAVDAEYERVAC